MASINVLAALGASVLAAVALTLPAEAAGPFDGTYNGTVKLVRSTITTQGRSDCGSITVEGRPSTRRIVDNKVTVPYGTGGNVQFDIGADGTVSGSAAYGSSQLTTNGKVTGGTLSMEYGSRYCWFRFDGTK